MLRIKSKIHYTHLPSVSVVTVIDTFGPTPILVDAATDILYSLNLSSPVSSIESVEPDVESTITFPPLVI